MLEHKHLLLMADIHNPLKDEELTTFWFDDLICKLKMNKLIEPQAVYCDVEGNRGLTCICAIETSHIVLHIWDEPVPQALLAQRVPGVPGGQRAAARTAPGTGSARSG